MRCAFAYAKTKNIQTPFNKEKEEAGKDWVAGFQSRHNIVLRKPEGTSLNRITAFNRDEVSILWKNLSLIMENIIFHHRGSLTVMKLVLQPFNVQIKYLPTKVKKGLDLLQAGKKGKQLR